MLDLEQLQIIGQLVDNIEIMTGKLEDSFKANDSEDFARSRKEILETQKKIVEMIKQNKDLKKGLGQKEKIK